jgi:hypothetical protein
MAKPIDLTKLTDQELRNFIANNKRASQLNAVQEALQELESRGKANPRDYDHLTWNRTTVAEALQPFKQIAASIKGNQRIAYTEAGGRRIGRPKDDPDREWIDSYSAIKTDKCNAVFVCYVKRPGDEPRFELHFGGVCRTTYGENELEKALTDWREVSTRAV